MGSHCANFLCFLNVKEYPSCSDGFSSLPLFRICPHEDTPPPLVHLPSFLNIVGVLHLVSIICINFLISNDPFINSSSALCP